MSSYIQVLLYLQTAYSIWVFVRDAKFFRLPYVLLSSMWHKGICHTILKKRKYIKFVHAGGLFEPDKSLKTVGIFETNKVGGRTVVKYKFTNAKKPKQVLCDDTTVGAVEGLFKLYPSHVFSSAEDLLIPGHYLIKRITFEEGVQKFFDGFTPILCEERCWVDQTSSLKLNSNFLRMASIFPIYLQAKGVDSGSVYASLAIICFDFFSYYPNLLWLHFKLWLYRVFKWGFAKLPLVQSEFLHHFFCTISENFKYCDESMKKSYYYQGNEVLVVEECILPDYVTDIVEFTPPETENCNIDGKTHEFHFQVNLHKHTLQYQYEAGFVHAEVFLNGKPFMKLPAMEQEDFDADLRNWRELERIGLYPAQYVHEGGIHVAKTAELYEGSWRWSQCKLLIKEGMYVSNQRCEVDVSKAFYWENAMSRLLQSMIPEMCKGLWREALVKALEEKSSTIKVLPVWLGINTALTHT